MSGVAGVSETPAAAPPATPVHYGATCVAERFDLENYAIDYIAGDGDLVISFAHSSHAGHVRDLEVPPWGYTFLRRRGAAILGVKPRRNDWYRGADIIDFFQSARFRAVLARHDRHVFYGGSMGGFAASAFASAAPGCIVIAHNPQSTLDRHKVPWEKRFLEGKRQDWTGAFADAAESVTSASRVLISYDPFMMPDRLHGERYRGDNVHRLLVPFVGHGMPAHLQRMGILGKVFARFLEPQPPSAAELARLARARRSYTTYLVRLAGHVPDAGRATGILTRALRMDPGDPYVLMALARGWIELGKHHEALVAAQALQYMGVRWRTPGKLLTIQAFERMGDMPRAFRELQAAMAMAPHDKSLAAALVVLAPKAGRVEEAFAILDRAKGGPSAAYFALQRRRLAECGAGPEAAAVP